MKTNATDIPFSRKIQEKDLAAFRTHFNSTVVAKGVESTRFARIFLTVCAVDTASCVWAFSLTTPIPLFLVFMIGILTCWILQAVVSGQFMEGFFRTSQYVARCNKMLSVYHLYYCIEGRTIHSLPVK